MIKQPSERPGVPPSSRRQARGLALGLGVALSLVGDMAFAEEPSRDKPVVQRTERGLHFTLPPDWPVEERGGVVGPIPIEEYLARKFASLETRLRALEQQVSSLDLRLRVAEEKLKEQKRMQSSEAQP